jgi:hypothetical protein
MGLKGYRLWVMCHGSTCFNLQRPTTVLSSSGLHPPPAAAAAALAFLPKQRVHPLVEHLREPAEDGASGRGQQAPLGAAVAPQCSGTSSLRKQTLKSFFSLHRLKG